MMAQDLRMHQSQLSHINLDSCFSWRVFEENNEEAIAQDKQRTETLQARLEFVKESFS
jgi:hypothetical protein